MKTLTLGYDQNVENPCDGDGWKVYSFSNRHASFKHPDHFFRWSEKQKCRIPQLWLDAKLRAGTAFVLSYYEHSMCQWSLKGEGPKCQWDSVQVAGVLVWEWPVNHLGPRTYADREKDARAFIQVYTDWCNGSVYWFSVEDDKGEEIDSSGGWYDSSLSDMAMEVRSALDGDTDVEIVGTAAWLADYHDFVGNASKKSA